MPGLTKKTVIRRPQQTAIAKPTSNTKNDLALSASTYGSSYYKKPGGHSEGNGGGYGNSRASRYSNYDYEYDSSSFSRKSGGGGGGGGPSGYGPSGPAGGQNGGGDFRDVLLEKTKKKLNQNKIT